MTCGSAATFIPSIWARWGEAIYPRVPARHNKMRFGGGGMGVMTGVTGILLFIHMISMSLFQDYSILQFTCETAVLFNGFAGVLISVSVIIMAVEANLIRRHGAAVAARNIIVLQNVLVL